MKPLNSTILMLKALVAVVKAFQSPNAVLAT